MVGYSGKVDHFLMPGPGGPELEHSFSMQPPLVRIHFKFSTTLSVFQYSALIINGCGFEMGVV